MAKFSPPKGAERRYMAALKKVAKVASRIVLGHVNGAFIDDIDDLMRELDAYAVKLDPWAQKTAAAFVADVSRHNERAWKAQSNTIARILKGPVAQSAIGLTAKALHDAQVTLIKSIPLEAGKRAQALAQAAATGGQRADVVAQKLLETERITANRAMLIARTEIAKANASLTQARAQAVGCTHYIWNTAEDGDVRETHAAMNGKVCEWAAPPPVDEGGCYHPGGIYNCFLGDTPVAIHAGVRRIIRSPYTGVIVNIKVGGVAFRVTPNHPILTSGGWKPAGKLQRGDKVVACGLPAFRDNYINNAPPTFDEVYFALASAAEPVLGAKFDFYGDVPTGDVDCITVNNELLNRIKTGGLEVREKLAFALANGSNIPFSGVSGEVVHTLGAGGYSDGPQFIGGGIGEADDVCGAAVADRDIVLSQNAHDGTACDAKAVGDGFTAFTGVVAGDDVCFGKREAISGLAVTRDSETSFSQFDTQNVWMAADSGGSILEGRTVFDKLFCVEDVVFGYAKSVHVYTLETVDGWYRVTPAGIIAKNCRCFAAPILDEAALQNIAEQSQPQPSIGKTLLIGGVALAAAAAARGRKEHGVAHGFEDW